MKQNVIEKLKRKEKQKKEYSNSTIKSSVKRCKRP